MLNDSRDASNSVSAVSSSSIQRLFLHDYCAVEVASLNHDVAGAGPAYSQRALILAQPGDIVIVGEGTDPAYLGYLNDNGLGPDPEGVVTCSPDTSRSELLCQAARTPSQLAQISAQLDPGREAQLSSYYGGYQDAEFRRALQSASGRDVATTAGSAAAVELANRKDLVRAAARRLGIPVAAGEVVPWPSPDPSDVVPTLIKTAARYSADGNGVIVRGARSLAGLDNLKLHRGKAPQNLADWVAKRADQPAFLVESLLTFSASPNVQARIDDDGEYHVVAVTDQRLDASFAHFGNCFPHASCSETEHMVTSALTLCDWLSKEGYRGPIGFDFLLCPRSSEPGRDHYLAEINGRTNCATYTTSAFERINQRRGANGLAELGCWVSNIDLRTPCRSFGELQVRASDLLYQSTSSVGGVLPYFTGLLPKSSVATLTVANTVTEALDLESQFAERIAF